ncbi:FTR1 family protein [Catenulispora sp. NF23]|uniref:FTR1 family protein n=1 Tax=Catenulispora pinistramenti TaxID=2705254 RepID=A0ABS5KMR0_9ACTN|nr:iron uptake transporter permease EfeU [Catenulispora pinistramenti]MBS2531416.1 FTR1 family protein [Catenulispora pinistramenti]MBS2547348.1 FTR1 family protein [Catenulispora pinistramenti]
MTWADAAPNLLIGLREGLEAGLVVSILLAALRKAGSEGEGEDRPVSTAPVWLGVLGAVMLSGAFAAVLTYSTSVLSSKAQQAVGGVLSVLAVALVTGMVFWMRRTAATLSSHLRGEVRRAAILGAGALTLTAFLAVGREGLETTLFMWTAVKASGSTVSPLVGAGLGLAAAIVLCWLLYRRAVKINVGVFFNRTAIALIVIAAGVLSYGLGDLQEAGWLPGQQWVSFDLTAHVDPNSWWVSIITGITDLAPKLTVLQVVAWVAYLAVVIPAFVYAGRVATAAMAASKAKTAAAAAAANAAVEAESEAAAAESPESPESQKPRAPSTPQQTPEPEPEPVTAPGWERLAGNRPWSVAGVLIVVPALAAGITIAALPAAAAATTTTVKVTGSACAPGWNSATTGKQTFDIDNKSSKAGEITLLDSSGAIVGEIETLGPATTAPMTATLGSGSYTFHCLMSGASALTSSAVQVSGSAQQGSPLAVKPVTLDDLTGPNKQYQQYAAGDLTTLQSQITTLRAAIAAGNVPAAQADWLAAQLTWEQVGASYDSFGDAGVAVDGLPDGLPDGVNDSGFTGLHRIEYGLYHGQSAAQLLPVVDGLAGEIGDVQKNLTTDDIAGDPTNLPLRAHEIIEDAIRDHLSGMDDEGAGAAYAMTYADTQVDQVVLGELGPLIDARSPGLVARADAQLTALDQALDAAKVNGAWLAPSVTPLVARQKVDAATGTLLETLASVPDLLEIPPTAQ